MQCYSCGMDNAPGADYCARCGATMKSGANAVPEIGVGASYGNGWRMLWKHFWMLLLIGIIYFAISMGSSVFQLAIRPGSDAMIIATALVGVLTFAYSILIVTPIEAGLSYAYLKGARNETPDIEDLFKCFKNYWNVVGGMILAGLIVLIGLVLLIIPGIVFACKLAFVPYLLIDKHMGAMESIRESWRMTGGHAWKVFGIILLSIPISIAGLLCLGIGVIIAGMWFSLALASLYYAVDSARNASLPQGVPVA